MSHALMQTELAKTYRLIAVLTLIAAAAIGVHSFLPEKRVDLLPVNLDFYELFYDGQGPGTTEGEWVNKRERIIRCTVKPGGIQWNFCGVMIEIGSIDEPVDLSKYNAFDLKATYDGSALGIRMINYSFETGVSEIGDWGSYKTLFADVFTEEAKSISLVPHDWEMSSYWKDTFKPPRKQGYPDFSNVFKIGIDIKPPIPVGEHTVKLESFVARGEWVSAENWYLGVALFWLLANLLIVGKRLYDLHRRVSLDSQRIDTLALYSDELRDESEKYKQLSSKDNLTGALNRNGLLQFINNSFPEGHFSAQLGLVVIDLDHFKKVNDEKGHDMGDEVLRSVSSTIRNIVRQEDGFCRWGGEEFVLICPNTNERDTFIIAEKIRQAVASILFEYGGESFHVTASLGVGLAKPNESFEDLFKRVDKALYEAKALGRNCVNKAA